MIVGRIFMAVIGSIPMVYSPPSMMVWNSLYGGQRPFCAWYFANAKYSGVSNPIGYGNCISGNALIVAGIMNDSIVVCFFGFIVIFRGFMVLCLVLLLCCSCMLFCIV